MSGRVRAGAGADWRQAIIDPVLAVAPSNFLMDLRNSLESAGVCDAVARRDSAPIFDWMVPLIQLQGISDAIALSYIKSHGAVRWDEIEAALLEEPSCPRLQSYWHFSQCGFTRSSGSCSEPLHLPGCPLPSHPLRKGILNQAAYSLFLFIRDICEGVFVTWIDEQLSAADGNGEPARRSSRMRAALLDPLRNVTGISDKLWSMILADLLLGGDPRRERWVTTGASFVAVDTLVYDLIYETSAIKPRMRNRGSANRSPRPPR